MKGLIERFDKDRGYGWIKPLIGKPQETDLVFFHRTAIAGRRQEEVGLPKGCEVSFDLVRGVSGRPQAANITLVTLPTRSVMKQ